MCCIISYKGGDGTSVGSCKVEVLSVTMFQTKEPPASSPETNEQVCKNAVTRLANFQLVSSTYDKVSTTYAATKDYPVIKSVCDVAERGIKTVAMAAAEPVQAILTTFEPQIAVVNEYACQGLDKLAGTLPILQQPVDQVISDTKELLSNTVAGAKDAIYTTVAEAQNAVTEMVDMVIETVQESVAATKYLVTSMSTVLESPVGQKLANSNDKWLGETEEWVDNILPIMDEELAKIATTREGFETVEQQKRQKSYYVLLGSLSTKVRQRAYQHSLAKVKKMCRNIKESLSQFLQTLKLIEHFRQMVDHKLQDVQEKLRTMRLQGSTPQPVGLSDEQKAQLLMAARILIEHLQATTVGLISGLHGLPDDIQERVRQFQKSVDDIHDYLSSVSSLKDVSSSIFSQLKEKAIQAQAALEELIEYLSQHLPPTWFVGPFAPSGEPAESILVEQMVQPSSSSL